MFWLVTHACQATMSCTVIISVLTSLMKSATGVIFKPWPGMMYERTMVTSWFSVVPSLYVFIQAHVWAQYHKY